MPSDSRNTSNHIVAVDGVYAAEAVAPADAQEAAGLLADAAARGRAVAPVGGGTALSLGNAPERLDIVLSTERLGGIIDYEPTDLVVSVGAGARLGDVQAVLGEHGQRLPIDPPGGAEATIGGLIATGRWGPLRQSAGTLRDLLIGISVAHPSGTVTRAGGMVVKNVSGYDLPRLYHGSLGTLGVIVSANFKVLPRPRAETTLVASFAEPAAAFAEAARIRSVAEPVAALEVARIDGAWLLAARIEGRGQSVAAISNRLESSLGRDTTRLEGIDSADWWPAYVSRQAFAASTHAVLVRCGVRPRETATLALGMIGAMENLSFRIPELWASPGLGTVMARLEFGEGAAPERLAEAQSILMALAEATTILVAPPEMKRGIDVWGRLPEGFEVMRALRAEFDPERTVNPGRFAGFL